MTDFIDMIYVAFGFILMVGVAAGYMLRSAVQWFKDNPPRGE